MRTQDLRNAVGDERHDDAVAALDDGGALGDVFGGLAPGKELDLAVFVEELEAEADFVAAKGVVALQAAAAFALGQRTRQRSTALGLQQARATAAQREHRARAAVPGAHRQEDLNDEVRPVQCAQAITGGAC
jgi:hypothetical protein